VLTVVDEQTHTTENGQGPDLSLGAFLRRQRELAELTLNQFAGTIGISNAYLSQIERGLRRPSQTVLQSIANGLHLSADAVASHVHVDDGADDAPAAVLTAIERDDRLTGRQRQSLAETYRAYVALNAGRRTRRRTTSAGTPNDKETA
jgi:transcriptional regulator with XRE-family HTH domain